MGAESGHGGGGRDKEGSEIWVRYRGHDTVNISRRFHTYTDNYLGLRLDTTLGSVHTSLAGRGISTLASLLPNMPGR